MSEITKEQVVEYLSELSIMDLMALKEELEAKWGVDASAAVAVAAAPGAAGAAAAPAEEQTEFNVVLESYGENKINVIKVIRQVTGLGLKEAKALVEEAPKVIKEGVDKEEGTKMKEALEEAGATVSLK